MKLTALIGYISRCINNKGKNLKKESDVGMLLTGKQRTEISCMLSLNSKQFEPLSNLWPYITV